MNACVPTYHQPCTRAVGVDVACSLVSNPVGDTYLHTYNRIGWSGTNRSLVLLKAEEAYAEFLVTW